MAYMAIASTALSLYQSNQQQEAGKAQGADLKRQGEYNAQVYEQQGQMVLEQKKLKDYQNKRLRGRAQGAIVSKTAGKGLDFGGSPMAVLIDNESQMLLDNAVENYNLDVQRNYALSAAKYSRETGFNQSQLAIQTGKTNSYSTLLNSTSNYYGYAKQAPKATGTRGV